MCDGVVGGEEQRGAGQLVRAGDPPHRRHRPQLVAAALLPVLAAERGLGLDEAGREDVDPHGRREGVRVGLGEAEDPVLRRGVLRGPRAAADDHRRADVDDRAAALVEHPRAELVRARHRALDVDGQHVVDGLLGHVAPRHLLAGHVADVVDHRVDLAELVERLRRRTPSRCPTSAMSAWNSAGAAPAASTRSGGLLGALPRAAVVDADGLGALLRGAEGDRRAEPGARSGDDDGAPLEAARDRDGARVGHDPPLCPRPPWSGRRLW